VAEAEDGPEWATDEEYEEYQRRTAAEGEQDSAAEDSADEPDADSTPGADDSAQQEEQEQAGPLAVTRR
jgi:hypothetical protein